MKYLLSISILLVFLTGCGKPFFEKDMIMNLPYKSEEASQYIYYGKSFDFKSENELTVTSHYVIRFGSDEKRYIPLLSINNGDLEKLDSYNSRLIKKDGSTETFGMDNLLVVNMSGRERISNEKILILRIQDKIKDGDILEIVYQHKNEFPKLGEFFSVPEEISNSYNINCSVLTPSGVNPYIKLINDATAPAVRDIDGKKTEYTYSWNSYKPIFYFNPYTKKRNAPTIYIGYPYYLKNGSQRFGWKEFGNWYLELISKKLEPDAALKEKALEITNGINDDKEKMDAIFKFCQKAIRYEQVYFEFGGIIPNNVSTIYKNGFGDCKDYSALIYAMAKSVGLNVNLALCYRGRGVEELQDIAVQQFNHMITCFRYNNKRYWYDGTNRDGLPGVTTSDLINQKALILEEDNSAIEVIPENENNVVFVTGKLKAAKTELVGEMTLKVRGQFSVDFRYLKYVLNKQEFNEFITWWLRDNLNRNIIIDSLSTAADRENFSISFRCKTPNAFVAIDTITYLAMKDVFPDLIPPMPQKSDDSRLFFNPAFNKWDVELELSNLFPLGMKTDLPCVVKWNHYLPAGPFSEDGKKEFVEKYQIVIKDFIAKHKYIKREIQ